MLSDHKTHLQSADVLQWVTAVAHLWNCDVQSLIVWDSIPSSQIHSNASDCFTVTTSESGRYKSLLFLSLQTLHCSAAHIVVSATTTKNISPHHLGECHVVRERRHLYGNSLSQIQRGILPWSDPCKMSGCIGFHPINSATAVHTFLQLCCLYACMATSFDKFSLPIVTFTPW